jgi:hypothetical protein
MARQQLIGGFCLFFFAPFAALAESDKPPAVKGDEAARPKAEAAAGGGASPRPFKLGPKAKQQATKAGPEVENVYRALEALTPEQQKNFKENFIRWINLSPDQKRAMREREENRKRKMVEETQAALQETGLTLDPAQRAKFSKRYAEERRKIEEKLRKESEEKRKPLVAAVITQLRSEFAGSTAVAATPVPGR